ncbi:hypothetical protein EVAR_61837_1 [Eumeta japonica]|uniref:Uncharacterized protein n=1 Tax=Eumeta variegata TaxID=151549 RepID=A0A4C1YWV0_EUMVA|nr:hypothetical protein EVAR_61837_1 [Eumeta japonica]
MHTPCRTLFEDAHLVASSRLPTAPAPTVKGVTTSDDDNPRRTASECNKELLVSLHKHALLAADARARGSERRALADTTRSGVRVGEQSTRDGGGRRECAARGREGGRSHFICFNCVTFAQRLRNHAL